MPHTILDDEFMGTVSIALPNTPNDTNSLTALAGTPLEETVGRFDNPFRAKRPDVLGDTPQGFSEAGIGTGILTRRAPIGELQDRLGEHGLNVHDIWTQLRQAGAHLQVPVRDADGFVFEPLPAFPPSSPAPTDTTTTPPTGHPSTDAQPIDAGMGGLGLALLAVLALGGGS